MNPFFLKLRALLNRRRKEEDLRDELQFHLEEEAEERQAAGLTGEQARRAAHREIGNLTLVQEETRAVWAVLAPMPSASERIASRLNALLPAMFRNP